MFPIHNPSALAMAFPVSVIQFMPKWEDIPEEFKNGSAKECKLASEWFSVDCLNSTQCPGRVWRPISTEAYPDDSGQLRAKARA